MTPKLLSAEEMASTVKAMTAGCDWTREDILSASDIRCGAADPAANCPACAAGMALRAHIAALEAKAADLENLGNKTLKEYQRAERERIVALADNAALLERQEQVRTYIAPAFAKMPSGMRAVMGHIEDLLTRDSGSHPGAHLLAEHAKALAQARSEGLEKAAQRFDVAAASLQRYADKAAGKKTRLEWAEQVEVMEGFARDIRAMKEPES